MILELHHTSALIILENITEAFLGIHGNGLVILNLEKEIGGDCAIYPLTYNSIQSLL